MKTVKKNLVHGDAKFALRGFGESQPNVTGFELDAVEIARHAPVRSEKHDRGGVNKLPLFLVVAITEPSLVGQLLHVALVDGEVDPTGHPLALILLIIGHLLLGYV